MKKKVLNAFILVMFFMSSLFLMSASSGEPGLVNVQETGTATLNISSSPDSGISINATKDENGKRDGITPFSRTYEIGKKVILVANSNVDGKSFSKWVVDGVESTKKSVKLTMSGNNVAVAVYEDEIYRLSVQSTHGVGAEITVSPSDDNGDSDGSTHFERRYQYGTVVTLTCPSTHNGKNFSHWKIDGKNQTSALTVQVTVDQKNKKTMAFYTTPTPSGLKLNRKNLNFAYIIDSDLPESQNVYISLSDSSAAWSALADVQWLTLSPDSGTGSAQLTVGIEPTDLNEGTYTGTITVTAPGMQNSPQTISVTLIVYKVVDGPIGEFSTPMDGSEVSSSVPLTGWAAAQSGIESVKIYLDNNGIMQFIGDAVFVEGARPDIEALYPDYPNIAMAGWGYMLLTNLLPDNGSGIYTLYAVATDNEGNIATLGVKTIIVDNANASKPFGAIDLPGAGATISGSDYTIFGWVLTPQPNRIPEDGSTIEVYVDGINLGTATYGGLRTDIAALFPGYENSGAAGASFELDTTAYANGIHTLFWIVTDDAGNAEGVGSRFFIIQNDPGETLSGSLETSKLVSMDFNKPVFKKGIPADVLSSANVRFPMSKDNGLKTLYPDKNGVITVSLSETGSLELFLKGSLVDFFPSSLDFLPGSFFDHKNGIFRWHPVPGFLGKYPLSFIGKTVEGKWFKKDFLIVVKPKN